MQHFSKCFRRERSGVWICVVPVEVVLPQGRIQVVPGLEVSPGKTFMGVDLAKLLNEQH
jgi:hypothetical protein